MRDKIINKIIKFIKNNKDITSIDEVLIEIPSIKTAYYELKLNKEPLIKEALKNNKIRLKRALKVKLFKMDTPQALAKLNDMLDKEQNNDIIKSFIKDISEQWKGF